MVKHLPTTLETWVRSLGREDPLEKEMATHSSILAWKIPWTEDVICFSHSPWGHKESDTTEQIHFHFQHILVRLLFVDALLIAGDIKVKLVP